MLDCGTLVLYWNQKNLQPMIVLINELSYVMDLTMTMLMTNTRLGAPSCVSC